MPGFLDKIKGVFGGKNRKKDSDDDRSSIRDRYGVGEEKFYENPLFQKDTGAAENEAFNPLYGTKREEPEQTTVQDTVPMSNSIKNIGGLPTVESIRQMSGGLDSKKLGKHKEFESVLNALESYQRLMQQEHTITMDLAKGAQRYIVTKKR